jgi:hypothetical protein
MRFLISFLFLCVVVFSCAKKLKNINSDEPIEAIDFIESFNDRELPILFNQKELNKKETDSFFIKAKTVSQFVPDSLFKTTFDKLTGVKFYRHGKFKADTKETYVFLTAERKEKKAAYIISFDKDLAYSAGMELVQKNNKSEINFEGGIDKKLTVIKQRNRLSKDGKLLYNKSAYVYNTEGLFTLILTESNEAVEKDEIYNPIDSFSTKDLLSGNYKQDDKNFVSIRDGGKEGKLLFFISISKKSGICEGKLRGDIVQIKPKVYQYNKSDDHCILEFTFSKNKLAIKELEACGNHRGVRCNFDGSYQKAKD